MNLRCFTLALLLRFVASGFQQDFHHIAEQATAARNANDVPHAINLYKEALRVNPRWDEGWWFLGSLLYDSDRYSEGRDALTQFVKLQPNAGAAWGLLGLCEFETKDYASSQTHIAQSLAVDGHIAPQMEAVLRYHQAMALNRSGEYDKALQSYIWFLSHGAPNDSILLGMGLATLRSPLIPEEIPTGQRDLFRLAGTAASYTLSNDPINAKQAFDQLVARYPSAPNVHYARGLTLIAKNTDEALDDFKRELQISPSNADAATMIAWILIRDGEYRQAAPFAETASHNAKNSAIAEFVWGRTLVETGQVDSGIQHLQHAETIDPSFLEAHLSLVTAYSRKGLTAEAQRERKISFQMTEGQSGVVRP